MGDKSNIEWTDATWNPIRGCSRVSAGCEHCYAEQVAKRFSGPGMPYEGLVRIGKDGKAKAQWNGTIRLVPEHLGDPLRWTKPRLVFVNSMSDLFHPGVPFKYVAAVFGVMAASPRHTFQVLTKRPERASEFFAWLAAHEHDSWTECHAYALLHDDERGTIHRMSTEPASGRTWPLPNIWLGVSVEDQASADARIPTLLTLPAAVRWVSYEPAIGPVDFDAWLYGPTRCRACGSTSAHYDTNPHGKPVGHTCSMGAGFAVDEHGDIEPGEVRCSACGSLDVHEQNPLDWLVIGGESGSGARPFDLARARSTIRACREAAVPVFFKQAGARPVCSTEGAEIAAGLMPTDRGAAGRRPEPWTLRDRKGGDPAEWPEDLRVREYPKAVRS